MKNLYIASIAAIALLAGCGGTSGTTPPTAAPSRAPQYAVALHWEPASVAGISALSRRASIVRTVEDVSGTTVVVQSGDAGSGGAFDVDNGSPAYVSVSVSPEPSPMPTVAFSTTAQGVSILATPTPLPNTTPNAAASPAVVLVPVSSNTASTGSTVTANAGGVTATDSIVVIKSLAVMLPHGGTQVDSSESPAYTFDTNCNAIGQNSPTGADLYLSGPISGIPAFLTNESENTLHYPAGGAPITHGYDITTLSAGDWQNAGSSYGLNALAISSPFLDTIIFKTGSGRVVYLSVNEITPGNGSAASAFITAGYGCL